ncbi:Protein kinase-like domain [Pseudocohnilembus persalinus]|uniref:Protein kinase-like domain n=1 Tax=Pseudocohnilembus persalinus TaxID=266149 RepID=A0A0V0QKG4_PSEPJ|nr:Protein kinase-like domain [Pseudocohnilembus persalinus]|eukprot:KRX02711.1 Protein kinase-like domain [Pseudocohnilembus persalinus]
MSIKSTLDIIKENETLDGFVSAISGHQLFVKNFSQEYKKVSTLEKFDENQGNVHIYQNNKNQQNFTVRTYTVKKNLYDSKNYSSEVYNVFWTLQNLIEANLRFHHISVMKMEGFSFEIEGDNCNLHIIMEGVQNSVQNLILERKMSKKQLGFSEILDFSEQMLGLLMQAQQHQYSLAEVQPKNIFFTVNKFGQRVFKYCLFYCAKTVFLDTTQQPANNSQFYEAPEIQFFKEKYQNEQDIQLDQELATVYSIGLSILNLALLMELPNRPTTVELEHSPLTFQHSGIGPDNCQWVQNLQTNIDFVKFMYKKEEKLQIFVNLLKQMLAYSPLNRPVPANLYLGYQRNMNSLYLDFEEIEKTIIDLQRDDQKLIDQEKKHGPSNLVWYRVYSYKGNLKLGDGINNLREKLGNFNHDLVYDQKDFTIPDFSNSVELGAYKNRETGEIYIGYWHEQKFHGKGKMMYPDGSLYEGYFVNGQPHIVGRHLFENGEYYTGQWNEGKMDGLGKKQYADGTVYNGQWKNGSKHGLGREIFPNGSKYEGDFVEGRKEGNGCYIWDNKNRYNGEFKNNAINGKGIYVWSDKRYFKGFWKDNKMEGTGEMVWPDGNYYTGEFKDDYQEGFGTFVWKNGKFYKGNWKQGKYHGIGRFYDAEGYLEKAGEYQNGEVLRWLDSAKDIKQTKEEQPTQPQQQSE